MPIDEKKRLLQTGVFKNESDTILFLLVKLINSKNGPVGSWTLKEDFEKLGILYGTATIGRYLKMLDSKGFTIQKSNQGRILTEGGGSNGCQSLKTALPVPKSRASLLRHLKLINTLT